MSNTEDKSIIPTKRRISLGTLFILFAPYNELVVSKTTCFFVAKSNKNLDFKGNLL